MKTIDEMRPKEILEALMNFPLEVKLEIFAKLARHAKLSDVILYVEDQYPSVVLSHFMIEDIKNLELYPAKIIDNGMIMKSLKTGLLYKINLGIGQMATLMDYKG